MKPRSLDDPTLSKDERNILRCVLTEFAKHHRRGTGMSLAKMTKSVIRLWECGYLTLEDAGDA
jgi:hypothetical protein